MASEDSSSLGDFPLNDDPISKLVLELLSKKPVNSEHFAIIKRRKPGEPFTKRPLKNMKRDFETTGERATALLKSLGFKYGRLKKIDLEKLDNSGFARLRAPGPEIKASEEETADAKPRKLRSQEPRNVFHPAPPPPPVKVSALAAEKQRGQSLRAPLEHTQGNYYLQFLTPKDKDKEKFVKKYLDKKMGKFKQTFEKRMEDDLFAYNTKGIFKEDVNLARANARLAVRMKAAAVLHSERIVQDAGDLYDNKPPESEKSFTLNNKDENFLRTLEKTIAKNVVRNKRTEVVEDFEVRDNQEWEKHISRIINRTIEKCTPNSRLINIPVCKLDLAKNKSYLY